MSENQFTSKPQSSSPDSPQASDSAESAASPPPTQGEQKSTTPVPLEARLSALEAAAQSAPKAVAEELVDLRKRVGGLELALASHAAPTLGKLHDNHGILERWFTTVRDRFTNHIGLTTLKAADAPEPLGGTKPVEERNKV